MEPMSIFEKILLGAMVLLLILWMRPGIKASMQQSREAKKDWRGVLIPIAFVVLFVIFMMTTVAGWH